MTRLHFLDPGFVQSCSTKNSISCWQVLLVVVVTRGFPLTSVSVLILASILARITMCSRSSLGIPGLFLRRVNRGHSISCRAVVLVWQALEHQRTLRHIWHRLFHRTGMSGDDWSAFRRKQQAHVNGWCRADMAPALGQFDNATWPRRTRWWGATERPRPEEGVAVMHKWSGTDGTQVVSVGTDWVMDLCSVHKLIDFDENVRNFSSAGYWYI